MIHSLFEQFVRGMKATTLLEYIAVFTGIISVWFSKKENILVYPVGLVNTIIYIYLSFKYHLLGEAGVNLYYTVMSLWGWWMWAKKNKRRQPVLHITRSSGSELAKQLLVFVILYVSVYFLLRYLKESFYEGAIPWADAFASASAFTGMWLMAKKKVESWWWWIATNVSSIPLYFVKGLVFTSVYYLVLLILAIFGLQAWNRSASAYRQSRNIS
jgi:nicotinamide mononucleotide transporter